MPSHCSPNLSFLHKSPEACNTVSETSLNNCLKITRASHIIWAYVSVVSPDTSHHSESRRLRGSTISIIPAAEWEEAVAKSQGSLTPTAVVLLQKEEGWPCTPHSGSYCSYLKPSVRLAFCPLTSAGTTQLQNSSLFRYNCSILILELNLRELQSTILPINLPSGRCYWTRKRLGLIVWQKEGMQVDEEELHCQEQ